MSIHCFIYFSLIFNRQVTDAVLDFEIDNFVKEAEKIDASIPELQKSEKIDKGRLAIKD